MYLQTISSEDIGKDKAMEFDNEAEDVASKRNGVGTGSVRGRVLDMRSYSPAKLQAQAAASKNMFQFAFQNYMEHAFPHDDLRPLSCRGSESYGNIGLTLLDALDSLVIFNDTSSFRAAVEWISENKTTFDVDVRIHVFEVTIRALGGLLSGHILATRDQTLVPGYDGGLLRAAVALADRLVPAFDTPTGLPTSWINLSKGHVRGDIRVTCTACAGTMLLEFATLSRMTGNVTYEMLAKGAIEALWGEIFSWIQWFLLLQNFLQYLRPLCLFDSTIYSFLWVVLSNVGFTETEQRDVLLAMRPEFRMQCLGVIACLIVV